MFKADPEQPLSRLTADLLPAAHAAAIEAALLLLAAEWTQDEPRPYIEAAARVDDLPLATRARLKVAEVGLRYGDDGDPLVAARELEAAGEGDCDHIVTWTWCASYVIAAFPSSAGPAELLRVALRGVKSDPDDVMANANVAFALRSLGRLEDARGYFEKALALASPDEPSNLHPALVANLFFAGGSEDEWRRWLRHLRTMRPVHRPGVLRQLQLDEADLKRPTPPEHFGRLRREL